MLYYLFSEWFNVVPPWYRGYGVVDAGMIADRLGYFCVMNSVLVVLASMYGLTSKTRKELFSHNPLMSIGTLFIVWLIIC